MERNLSGPNSIGLPETPLYREELLRDYDLASFEDRLKFLYRQLCSPQESNDSQSAVYMEVGCRIVGADRAFIVSSSGSIYRRVFVYRRAEKQIDHELSDAEEGIYRRIIDHDSLSEVVTGEQSPLNSPVMAANGGAICHYLGVPIVNSGNKCGVLCFLSPTRINPSPRDLETLQLMAEGVARMIELQNVQEKNRIEEIRGFATAGVKSLDEYISQARLPEVYGVSGRVVEVLQRRIGKQPLAIDYIAEELNLSKRTLQRRLQQQNVSFAQLRDQVRFHYSIDYLIHQNMSIDAISAALDFSDRTSFTNAFKRWTSLSPSSFRKLFRDYA
ncbi:helix-turn-helix domain-containing protein [Gilvimarinus sp. F26214L]|uniref:helix-turn-helix domain-containing protein n=1 Tax=Gilvimarinus sp. DZF01 TaxID=3461371 RepID=UPI004045C0EA